MLGKVKQWSMQGLKQYCGKLKTLCPQILFVVLKGLNCFLLSHVLGIVKLLLGVPNLNAHLNNGPYLCNYRTYPCIMSRKKTRHIATAKLFIFLQDQGVQSACKAGFT